VAPSGRTAALALAVLAPAALAGCVSTQRLDERARLRATRLLASRAPTLVTQAAPQVRVGPLAVLRAGGATAVVVTLRNVSDRALTDLPISVGYARSGRRVYLNRRAGLDYFQTHVPAIAARGRVRWVLTTRRRLPRGARPFALVGAPAAAVAHSAALPALVATAARRWRGGLAVRVRNASDVPQYGLPLYAFAVRGGRYLAAGRATLAHLGTRATATVRLRLVGAARGAAVSVEALPTIFR
jgi:hypothetical protein